MATYKVLQDIEGEDHLIAWLTPRQSIYAVIVIISCVLAFVLGRVNFLLAVPWLVPIGFFGFLAAPLGRDQPNDVWLGAQIRFYFKPRKRIWDQSGLEELVTITAPKMVEKTYTDGLSQHEVRSRLQALSTAIDSRGWAIKNSAVNMTTSPQFTRQFDQQNNDRLVSTGSGAIEVPFTDVTEADDIMDEHNNAVAQRFDQQIKKQEAEHIQQLRQAVQNGSIANTIQPTTATQGSADFYFMNQQAAQQAQAQAAQPLATFGAQVVAPGADLAVAEPQVTESDEALLEKIHHDQELQREIVEHTHEKVIKTASQVAEEERIKALQIAEQRRLQAEEERKRQAQLEMDRKSQIANEAKLKELAQSSDLKISTIASQAKHATENNDGEVVISLH